MINFKDELMDNSVIAAVRNEKDFSEVLESDINCISSIWKYYKY